MTLDTRHITTDRCRQFVRTAGTSGPAVVCIHGNLSTSVFWEETMTALAGRARLWAPDLRGFGQTEPLPIDATRGLLDFTDDLAALFKAEGLGAADPVHLIGWSVGGAVAMQLAMALPDTAASLTLINPMSPFGFGGTRDAQGTPTTEDFAGSGGGTANPDLVQRLADQDRSQDSPTSPLSIMLAFYINPSCTLTHQSDLLGAMLDVRIGDDHYPGDSTPSPHWPGVAPGTRGMNNAISPKYCNLSGFAALGSRATPPPVLWIRGADDAIVSDTSMFDFGTLGQLGAVPGWPGDDPFPPQPMVAQTRAVLDAYRTAGGTFSEVVMDGVAHSPHLEKPETFQEHLITFLGL